LTSRQRPCGSHVVSLLLNALEAFYREHRRCGELDGGVDGDRIWMARARGAVLARVMAFG
jgi:hypothetical protein